MVLLLHLTINIIPFGHEKVHVLLLPSVMRKVVVAPLNLVCTTMKVSSVEQKQM